MTTPSKTNSGGEWVIGEFIAWLTVIALVNLPLLTGDFSDRYVFYVDRVVAGEWWRVLTFPIVHVSLYHLLLDALAFLWLWYEMRDLPALRRWSVLSACWGMSLIMPLLLSNQVGVHGLSGLSGIGHGLFVFYALDCARRAKASKDRLLYQVSLALVAGLIVKSGLETFAGQLFFSGLHFGPIGVPIVETHLGGVVGGLMAYACLSIGDRYRRLHLLFPQKMSGSCPQPAGLGLESEVKSTNNRDIDEMNLPIARRSQIPGGKCV